MSESNRARVMVEGIGLAAVIISLVFVGFEIRQNTAEMRAATQQAIYEAGIESNLNLMTNERLRELIILTRRDPDWVLADTTADHLLLERFYLNRFNNHENAFYHFSEETFDPRLWAGHDGFLRLSSTDPLMLHYWTKLRSAFMPEFQAYMDSTLVVASDGDPTR